MENNIIIKKVYEDNELIELKIMIDSPFVKAYQFCYIQDIDLIENAEKIIGYSKNFTNDCYVEFGKKEGNYTPAFSLKFLKANLTGHLKIEVDIEIEDNDERLHRCCCYVDSELGLVENFGLAMKKLVFAEVGSEISMLEL